MTGTVQVVIAKQVCLLVNSIALRELAFNSQIVVGCTEIIVVFTEEYKLDELIAAAVLKKHWGWSKQLLIIILLYLFLLNTCPTLTKCIKR